MITIDQASWKRIIRHVSSVPCDTSRPASVIEFIAEGGRASVRTTDGHRLVSISVPCDGDGHLAVRAEACRAFADAECPVTLDPNLEAGIEMTAHTPAGYARLTAIRCDPYLSAATMRGLTQQSCEVGFSAKRALQAVPKSRQAWGSPIDLYATGDALIMGDVLRTDAEYICSLHPKYLVDAIRAVNFCTDALVFRYQPRLEREPIMIGRADGPDDYCIVMPKRRDVPAQVAA